MLMVLLLHVFNPYILEIQVYLANVLGNSGSKFVFFQQIEDERQQFKAADLNRDGFLNGEEFALFTHPWKYREMYKLDVQRKLKEFDTDKDGLINLPVSMKYNHYIYIIKVEINIFRAINKDDFLLKKFKR